MIKLYWVDSSAPTEDGMMVQEVCAEECAKTFRAGVGEGRKTRTLFPGGLVTWPRGAIGKEGVFRTPEQAVRYYYRRRKQALDAAQRAYGDAAELAKRYGVLE